MISVIIAKLRCHRIKDEKVMIDEKFVIAKSACINDGATLKGESQRKRGRNQECKVRKARTLAKPCPLTTNTTTTKVLFSYLYLPLTTAPNIVSGKCFMFLAMTN